MLYRRKDSPFWWTRFTTRDGRPVRRSTHRSDRGEAQLVEARMMLDLDGVDADAEAARRTWREAVVRWQHEKRSKKSIKDDLVHIRWLDPLLGARYLDEINRDMLDRIVKARLAGGVSPATVNRTLAVVRSIMKRAYAHWEWNIRVPAFPMQREPKKRIRWITQAEATALMRALPEHLAAAVGFTLATGLREQNVLRLSWDEIDLSRRMAWVNAADMKTGEALGVPLNDDAMRILRTQMGKHPDFVFTYKGHPISRANTRAWRKGLKTVGIEDFRWHDLRHTWASWHVQNGTRLQELQELGGWSDFSMVLRYAHLAPEHLTKAASNVSIGEPGRLLEVQK